jgi:hypothetical protein
VGALSFRRDYRPTRQSEFVATTWDMIADCGGFLWVRFVMP